MTKNVSMFVWNHFTNDARVLRECTTLSQNGYDVRLICIDDPKNQQLARREQFNNHFDVVRVRRYPLLFDMLMFAYRLVAKYKLFLVLGGIAWGYLLYRYTTPLTISTILLFIMFLLISNKKIRTLWLRSNIFIRMIGVGYRRNSDIYHSNDLNTLIQGYVCAKWRIKKRQLIYDSHEVQTSRTGYNSPLYGKLEKALLKRVDQMMVENHTRAAYNEELYGFYPEVLHNYPFKQNSTEEGNIDLHKILQVDAHEKILLYQGGIQIGRGLEKLIEAAPHFDEGILVFIGDGRQKPELLEMVNDRNLHHRVKFIDKVPLKDLPKYTKNAYLGFQVLNNICYNHWSASSNKLFEYIMSNVPVVACSFPEIKKVVTKEQIGLCVDSHDPLEIAKGVNTLLRNPEMRQQMSENCHHAKEIYNWENEQSALLKIYSQVS